MKVAIFGTQFYEREYFDKYNTHSQHEFKFFNENLSEKTAYLAEGYSAVCVFVNDSLDKKCIEQLSKLRVEVIILRSAGFNNVDIEAAKAHHIKVLRVPAYSPEAVAEHAVAMIMTLNRKTHKAYNQVRESNFSLQNLMGFNLFGKTVGVVGTGKIGRAFCKIMLGFGCHVIAYDIKENETIKSRGVQYKSLDDLLTSSDIISIHCPLNEATTHLFNASSFAKLKKGMMLINTSRGGLIHTKDVIQALKEGQIGYLGIDVYEKEADLFFKDLSQTVVQDDLFQRLNSFNNVLITPHQAFYTKEALVEITTTTLNNISAIENNLALENEVK